VREAKRILDTTQHSVDHELSWTTMSKAFDLAGGGVLLLLENGRGRLYESKDELRAMLDEVEREASRGPQSPCREFPQGRAFAEQVPELVRGLHRQLKIDADQLDGTEASLDTVDRALRRMSHRQMLHPAVFAALTAYVGEVIRNTTKGRWEMRRAADSEKTWEPWVVDPSGRSYAPFKIYKELLEYGRSGSMRVFVQWELAHGTQQESSLAGFQMKMFRFDDPNDKKR
jgi:hypothetical protein